MYKKIRERGGNAVRVVINVRRCLTLNDIPRLDSYAILRGDVLTNQTVSGRRFWGWCV